MTSKFAFIICYNDSQVLAECLFYIEALNVPGGYETEVITIAEAESMTSGYNAAMRSTDAKFKVYLHQDVFIVNKDFLNECLNIFESDENIGVLGVIGCRALPENASAYDHWDIGVCYSSNFVRLVKLVKDEDEGIYDVEAVDGMLMVTQVDIPWREDIFNGWDFYDISQSMEFRKRGYRVVVHNHKKPWAVHDCGASKLINYDKYRKIFCDEYGEQFNFDGFITVSDTRNELLNLCSVLEENVDKLLGEGSKDLVKERLKAIGEAALESKKLMLLLIYYQIDEAEKMQGHNIFWKKDMNFDEMNKKWSLLKNALRRIEFDADEEAVGFIRQQILNGYFSYEAVLSGIIHAVSERGYVLDRLIEEADKHII